MVILSFRLFFAFSTETFDYDAYLGIRQINEILETNSPVFNDPLSYGGRTLLFSPLFYYLMAFFSIIVPYALKIIPNIFLSKISIHSKIAAYFCLTVILLRVEGVF